jgi:hypothetical protein
MPSDPPQVVQVPVKRYDINLSLSDILQPLTQFASQPRVVQAGQSTPSLLAHAQQLTDLASQLHDVVARLNALDPKLLAPTQDQSAGLTGAAPGDSTGSAGR